MRAGGTDLCEHLLGTALGGLGLLPRGDDLVELLLHHREPRVARRLLAVRLVDPLREDLRGEGRKGESQG